jgi:fused signal recognition particle receptor
LPSTPAEAPAAESPRASAPIAPAAEVRQRDTRADTASPPVTKSAPTRAPVAPPMPAAIPEPAPSAPPALAEDAAAPREAMGKSAVGGVAPAPAASPAAAAPATLRAEAQRKTTAPLPVDEWLARIRKLRVEGRADELAREIAAFRAAYPGEEKRLQEELARPVVPRSPG